LRLLYLAVGAVGHVRCVSGNYVCSDAVGVGERIRGQSLGVMSARLCAVYLDIIVVLMW
jgi:hypothetical protein